MNRTYVAILAAGIAISLAAAPQKDATAAAQMQAAINKQTVEGDLNGAIKQYAAIVAKYAKTDRATAAAALVRMAECHQAMGDAEARKIYEQVVKDFADQKEAAAAAQARLGGSAGPQRQTNTLIWSGPKVQGGGTISPDGRYISAVDWDTCNLVLREIGTGVDRRLTNQASCRETGDYPQESAISRDGKQVAYTWYNAKDKRAELRVGSLAGGFNPRTLYDAPDVSWITARDWSPDGKMIAVQITRTNKTAQIGLVSAPGGSLRVLKSEGSPAVGKMFFSPDGRYLGFDLPASDTSPQRDVFVISTDGAREVHAVAHRANDLMMGWSADGRWLFFTSDRTGSMALWGLPLADGKAQGAPKLLKSDLAAEAAPIGATRSGALYYVTRAGQEHSGIQTASFDFGAGRLLSAPVDLAQDDSASNLYPQWSPDGTRLSYISQHGSSRNSYLTLVIRSVDTGQVRELRPKLSYFFLPRWAPDGRSFLALATDLNGRRGMYRIDAETGEASALLVNSPAEQAVGTGGWSADGKSIYFPRRFPGSEEIAFIERDLATGKERVVIRRRGLGGIGISPDGRYIVTPSVDEASNSRTLLLIPVAGGEPRELMRVAAEVPANDLYSSKGVSLRQICWTADSRTLLFLKVRVRPQGEDHEVWEMSIDGNLPRKVDAELAPMARVWSIHPDGRRVAIALGEPAAPNWEIWALEHILPEGASR
jgi:Tol biopolymer transport system component